MTKTNALNELRNALNEKYPNLREVGLTRIVVTSKGRNAGTMFIHHFPTHYESQYDHVREFIREFRTGGRRFIPRHEGSRGSQGMATKIFVYTKQEVKQ